jgi:hypothetical protein
MTAGPVLLAAGGLTWAFVQAGIAVRAFVPLLFVLIIVGLFGSLAVSVDREAIGLRLGVGLIRKRIPIARIRDCRIVRNRWFYGWGIRLTPRGWMWNISGLDAVELDLDDSGHFRIGTDDPDGLRSAIRRARDAR